MNWNQTWKSLQKASPFLLTLIGVTGVVGTAVLTAKCTPKALERVEKKQETSTEPLKPLEKVIAATPAYLPAIGAGAVTIFAIVSSQILNHRQNLSLAATCTLLQHNFKTYKQKVVELFGKEANDEVEKSIAKDNFNLEEVMQHKKASMTEMFLWFEPNTQQYFWATEADVIKSEYEANRRLAHYGCCSLADYIQILRDETNNDSLIIDTGAENVGWDYQDFAENWDPDQNWIEFYHSFVESSDIDTPPYYIIQTPISPEWDYILEKRPDIELYIDENQCYAYDVR